MSASHSGDGVRWESWPDDQRRRVVGVIDLKDGHAVHAVAGVRHRYRPLAACNGDPLVLAAHYRRLGLDELYVADLDSLGGGRVQFQAITRLCHVWAPREVLVDVGWRGNDVQQCDDVRRLAQACPATCWIVASETATSIHAIDAIAQQVPPQRVLIGLDFAGGKWRGPDKDEASWIAQARRQPCRGAVVLDVRRVGTRSGPSTLPTCRRIRSMVPEWKLYSGGGVRDARDVNAVLRSGCDGCLIATALLDSLTLPRDPVGARPHRDTLPGGESKSLSRPPPTR